MFSSSLPLALFFSLCSSTAFATPDEPGPYSASTSANNVTIRALGKTLNSTGGEGHVAAGGILQPFGSIGVGCGIDWDGKSQKYGGGVNAGSDAFGLGGGYTISPDTMEVGAGIGINGASKNSSASVNFKGSTNATFELRFTSTERFSCDGQPTKDEKSGEWFVVCRTTGADHNDRRSEMEPRRSG